MLTRQIAGGPGNVLAPQDFLDHLRRETGDPSLHCWWEPSVALHVPRPDTGAGRGCWVVFQANQRWTNVQVSGPGSKPMLMHVLETVYLDVFVLDGLYGNSHDLGPWVADSMAMSRPDSRGFAERREAILYAKFAAKRDQAIKDHADTDYAAKHLKDVFQFVKDQRGRSPVTIREERVAAGAKFQASRDRRLKTAEKFGSDVSII